MTTNRRILFFFTYLSVCPALQSTIILWSSYLPNKQVPEPIITTKTSIQYQYRLSTMADLSSSSSSIAPPDLTALVESAANLPSGPQRDAALIDALRTCRKELDDAECECKAAQSRVSAAKDKFDALAMMIARVDASTQPTTSTSANPIIADGDGGTAIGKRGEAPSPNSNRQSNKKLPKLSSPSSQSPEDGGLDIPAPPIPTNPIHVHPQ